MAVNCAAIPDTLLESELFGYVTGAFTGARKNGKAGLFELAHTGTIFLDEIGEIPLPLQAKLLRVLQEREIMRVGGDSVIHVDIRIIAATNQNPVSYTHLGQGKKQIQPVRTRKQKEPAAQRRKAGPQPGRISLKSPFRSYAL